MSDNNIDLSGLSNAKGDLKHVSTEEKKSSVKPVFKCDAGHTMDIPADIQEKMEKDEAFNPPACSSCGAPTKLSVTG